MEDYSFKVVAELRNDLSEEQKNDALRKIGDLQRKFEIDKIDGVTYCKAGKVTAHDDFGAVTFFYCKLERIKEYFSKLEYHDLWEREKKVAV